MNKWIKTITPAITAAVVATLILMLSGLGTTSLTVIDNITVTQTTIKLDVNTFAAVMITGVALTVLLTGILTQSAEKRSVK